MPAANRSRKTSSSGCRFSSLARSALGLWDALASRRAYANDVRAALALVARGEVPLGMVYAPDARVEPDVRVVRALPAG